MVLTKDQPHGPGRSVLMFICSRVWRPLGYPGAQLIKRYNTSILKRHFSGEKSLPPQVGVLPSLAEDESPWFAGILGIDDLVKTDPQRGHFLQKLQELSAQKQNVLATFDESEENNDAADDDVDTKYSKALEKLTFEHNGHEIKLEDLHMTFQYSPSSTVFGLDQVKTSEDFLKFTR